MKKVLLFSLLALLTACSPKRPAVDFLVLKEDPNSLGTKMTIDVELKEKLSENQLKEIAMYLREEHPDFEKMFVFYNVVGLDSDMAWATTHFAPELTIEIIGSTEDQINKIKSTKIEGKLIGKWTTELVGGAGVFIYTNSKNELLEKMVFKNGQSMDEKLIEVNESGKRRFNKLESTEYMVIESDGSLGFYGESGKYGSGDKF